MLTPLQSSCMENFLVGGVWTQTRLYAAGYEVDQRCEACKEALDTIDHRLFCCRASKDARASLKWPDGWGSLEEARLHPLASRGLATDPSVGQPPPAATGDQKLQYTDTEYYQAFEQATCLYTDGGCTKEFHPKLNRATWAAVAEDEAGEITAASCGPVWATLPQTSQAGELVGLAGARQLARGMAKKLVSDCTNVVRAVSNLGRWRRKCQMYSGLLRES